MNTTRSHFWIDEDPPTYRGEMVGDLWGDSLTGEFKTCTSTMPVTWTSPPGGPPPPAAWGTITGTLSDQTDLNTELGLKETPAGAQAKVDAHAGGADPHAVYPLLLGRAGNTTIYGSIDANGDFILEGTSHPTKATSYVLLQPNGGNVGIGTVGPLYKLHIVGSPAGIALDGDAGHDAYVRYGNDGTAKWIVGLSPASGWGDDFTFYQAGVGPKLVITTGGAVGIGTPSPTQRLTVASLFTNPTNYEYATLYGTVGSKVTLAAETLGTGADNLDVELLPAGTGVGRVGANQIETQNNKGVANGYASLGAGGLVPMGQLASGVPDGTKFIRDDGTLQVPAGGPGGPAPLVNAFFFG